MNKPNPAYLLVGMTMHRAPDSNEVESRQQYQKLAGTALSRLGMKIDIVALGNAAEETRLEVLEGTYPFGTLVLERYSSVETLEAFWCSPEYKAAREIRNQFTFRDIHFIVAIEGVSAERSGPPPAAPPLAYTVTCPSAAIADGGTNWTRYGEIASSIDRGYKPQTLVQVQRDGVRVLEGTWPFPAGVGVKSHPSVQSVVDFWQHPTYLEAKTHRPALAMQAVMRGVVPAER